MKAKKTHTKKRRSVRSITVHAKPHKRRRKRGLSAGVNQASMMNSLKLAGAGAIGGYLANMTNNMLPEKIGALGRIGVGVLGGAVVSQFLGYNNIASGWVGGYVALNNPKSGLSEDVEFADDDALSEEPLYLSEEGIPLTLNEDGSYSYAADSYGY